MISFLVRHKEADCFVTKANPAEQASLPACKEGRLLLMRHLITQTKADCCGSAKGGGILRTGWLRVLSTLAIGFACFASPLRAQFAYVTSFSDSNVSAYTIDPATGALTAIPGSPFSAGADPVSVAVDPSGKFVYVANNAVGNIVSGFTIDPSGALTVIAGSPFSAGKQPNWVAVDPSGKFAYVANAGDNTVSGYTINPVTGVLTTIPVRHSLRDRGRVR
jgi:YVTN family beta-propeller protein